MCIPSGGRGIQATYIGLTIWHLPKIAPHGRCRIDSRTRPNIYKLPHCKSIYRLHRLKFPSCYRVIGLFSIAGKILAQVLLNRVIPTIAQEHTPESQCGFRSNRGTADMIFVLRQILEKCREQNIALDAAFVTDCGKSWRALALPPNDPPSSARFMKVSKVR